VVGHAGNVIPRTLADKLGLTGGSSSAVSRPQVTHDDLICNTLDHHLSNARSEAANTHLRALTKRAYGFHSPDALIAMAMLTRGELCPDLPVRKMTHYKVSRSAGYSKRAKIRICAG
jgi:Transposase